MKTTQRLFLFIFTLMLGMQNITAQPQVDPYVEEIHGQIEKSEVLSQGQKDSLFTFLQHIGSDPEALFGVDRGRQGRIFSWFFRLLQMKNVELVAHEFMLIQNYLQLHEARRSLQEKLETGALPKQQEAILRGIESEIADLEIQLGWREQTLASRLRRFTRQHKRGLRIAAGTALAATALLAGSLYLRSRGKDKPNLDRNGVTPSPPPTPEPVPSPAPKPVPVQPQPKPIKPEPAQKPETIDVAKILDAAKRDYDSFFRVDRGTQRSILNEFKEKLEGATTPYDYDNEVGQFSLFHLGKDVDTKGLGDLEKEYTATKKLVQNYLMKKYFVREIFEHLSAGDQASFLRSIGDGIKTVSGPKDKIRRMKSFFQLGESDLDTSFVKGDENKLRFRNIVQELYKKDLFAFEDLLRWSPDEALANLALVEKLMSSPMQDPKIAVLLRGDHKLIKDEGVRTEFDRIQRKYRHSANAQRYDLKAFKQLAQREQNEILTALAGANLETNIRPGSRTFIFFQMGVPYEKVDTTGLKEDVLKDYLARRDEALTFRVFEPSELTGEQRFESLLCMSPVAQYIVLRKIEDNYIDWHTEAYYVDLINREESEIAKVSDVPDRSARALMKELKASIAPVMVGTPAPQREEYDLVAFRQLSVQEQEKMLNDIMSNLSWRQPGREDAPDAKLFEFLQIDVPFKDVVRRDLKGSVASSYNKFRDEVNYDRVYYDDSDITSDQRFAALLAMSPPEQVRVLKDIAAYTAGSWTYSAWYEYPYWRELIDRADVKELDKLSTQVDSAGESAQSIAKQLWGELDRLKVQERAR